jgi:DNA-directed RNA polymerase subunit RPC12/RpoP
MECFRPMSEFKYACPVCGQHMQSDSSQTGAVVDCPTCFQKIVVPQAPADPSQKLILSGIKFVEKIAPKPPVNPFNPYAAKQVKGFSGALVVVGILLCMAAAAAFVYSGTIFNPAKKTTAATNAVNTLPKPARLAMIAPAANDTNWTLNLAKVNLPDAPPAGRIHGQDFITERATLSNGTLVFRDNTRGPLKFGLSIGFSGAPAESLAGKTITVATNTATAARVTLHWQDGTESSKENFDTGYAMRLEFGQLTNNHLPVKIYLCLPDAAKSYLAGTFTADARKPKPKKSQP